MDSFYQQNSELREGEALQVIDATGGPRYCLYRYEDVLAALKDSRFEAAPAPSSFLRILRWIGLGVLANTLESGILISLNPPDHTRMRNVIEPFFRGRAMAAWKPRVEANIEHLLDHISQSGQFDLVSDFAAPLPTRVIAEIFGFPEEDMALLQQCSDNIAPLLDSDLYRSALVRRLTAFLKFRRRVIQLVKERHCEPREDLLSTLAHAYLVTGELSKDEVVGMAVFVFTAGHETTKNLISSCVLILLKHPEILAQVRENPGLIDRVVEETLRLEGPVQRTARVLREEVELHGQRVPCGAKIRLMIGAANRDPRHFDNPDQFDIARSDKQHLGFGGGIHHCIGLRLGRLETSIAIGAIFQRFPGLKLVNEECRWGISTKLRGLSELIVQT